MPHLPARRPSGKAMLSLQPFSSDRLRDYLERKEDQDSAALLLDCRSFLSYNECHVSSALNAYCPSILRRRSRGKLPFHVLIPSVDVREKILRGHYAHVVLYEDAHPRDADENLSALRVVSRCLQQEGGVRNIYFLEGGFQRFRQKHAHLCVGSHFRSHGSVTALPSSSPSPTMATLSSILSGGGAAGAPLQQQHSNHCGKPFYEQGDPVEILPHLYLGSAFHAANQSTLERLAITALLNVSRTSPSLAGACFAYKCIPVDDSGSADISSWFIEATQFIDEVKASGGKVLVHCHAGISRSATICLAYLMATRHLRLEEAYEYVKTRRSIISPNFNFMGQLLKYESQLFAAAAPSRGNHCSSPLATLAAVVAAKAKESCLMSAQKFVFDVALDDSYSASPVSSPLLSPLCTAPILSPS